MPHLRELVEHLQDEPFTLLGVNTGDSEDDFRRGMESHDVTWTCAYQGEKESPIAQLFRVKSYPTILVLDGEGRIRHRNLRGPALTKAVEHLLAETRGAEGQGE